MNSVQGKVLHQGKPAKGAIVIFHPKEDSLTALRPSGVAGEDGTFTISTVNPNDGAPPGQYLVTITWPEEKAAPKKFSTEPPPDPVDRLQGRYASRDTSTIKVEIKKGTNQLAPFDLK